MNTKRLLVAAVLGIGLVGAVTVRAIVVEQREPVIVVHWSNSHPMREGLEMVDAAVELLATIPVDDTGELFAEHYGLGIYSVQLSCGTAWGHDGGILGFKTFAYTSPDGNRQAVLVYNDFQMSIPSSEGGTGPPAFQRDVKKATEIAFCGKG